MMTIADRLATKYECQSLITGESLGQVASQTPMALQVTDAMASHPVFRPCIGMDKEEIVQIAHKIDTFETSILPYEDCCTVFTPKHPKTKPELFKVEREEQKLDFEAFVERAMQTIQTYRIIADY
jgi:thiamine biosynthesis protein ThiI